MTHKCSFPLFYIFLNFSNKYIDHITNHVTIQSPTQFNQCKSYAEKKINTPSIGNNDLFINMNLML